jgi:hypothetical protein
VTTAIPVTTTMPLFNGLQVYLVAFAMLWLQSRCQPETLFEPT